MTFVERIYVYAYVGFTLWLGLGACNESSFGLDIVVMQ